MSYPYSIAAANVVLTAAQRVVDESIPGTSTTTGPAMAELRSAVAGLRAAWAVVHVQHVNTDVAP